MHVREMIGSSRHYFFFHLQPDLGSRRTGLLTPDRIVPQHDDNPKTDEKTRRERQA
jgi:hypothetical protein